MNKSQLARDYRLKYGKEMPIRKLARILYKDHNLLFKDHEEARIYLNKIEGKDKSRGIKLEKVLRSVTPYIMPKSYKSDRKPFKLPEHHNNILLISDIHIPYHDEEALELAIEYGVKNKVNTIFINGDLMDFHRISRFQSDPSKRSVKQEFEATKQFLQYLRSKFRKAAIYWLKGNHDIRYEHWLMTKVYEIWDDEYYHLEHRLALHEQNITLIDDKILVKAGKLSITHGHHIFKGIFVPVSPARGAFLRAKQSIIVGHLHRASHHPEIDLDGKVISCWSTGCLCELRPDYSPLVSNSQHGFAHIKVEKNGEYHVNNYQIINGKLY